MRCRSDDSRQCPRANVISTRGESNSMQGAGVKKTSQQRGWDALSQWRPRRKAHPGIRAQTGTWFPDGASSGNCDPESCRRVGHAFPMAAQAESASRNLSSEWDSFSRWRAQRKIRPGICSENGTRFPADRPALLNSKTCALSIPKLGRRKPKRNRRRST